MAADLKHLVPLQQMVWAAEPLLPLVASLSIIEMEILEGFCVILLFLFAYCTNFGSNTFQILAMMVDNFWRDWNSEFWLFSR